MPCEAVRPFLKQNSVCHERAPITPLGNVALIPQPQHQRVPHLCDGLDADPGCSRLAGVTVAGEAGYDQVKGITGFATVLRGIGQRRDDIQKFQYRSRPTVSHQQRLCITVRTSDVQKVDGQAINLGDEIVEGGEPRRDSLPVVVI